MLKEFSMNKIKTFNFQENGDNNKKMYYSGLCSMFLDEKIDILYHGNTVEKTTINIRYKLACCTPLEHSEKADI